MESRKPFGFIWNPPETLLLANRIGQALFSKAALHTAIFFYHKDYYLKTLKLHLQKYFLNHSTFFLCLLPQWNHFRDKLSICNLIHVFYFTFHSYNTIRNQLFFFWTLLLFKIVLLYLVTVSCKAPFPHLQQLMQSCIIGWGSTNGGQAFNTKSWKGEKRGMVRCGLATIFKIWGSQ